ncbi:Stp1/IreP family PP2C-type Ser/Thr phosphatase [Virgibacillus sp. C22-A2]|uniref:Stp1/IreP family PP2C-type Ser/Thr phosphatase n=1 Tax=Virgibacillus tibetensis TaxID=3042313 RepID=A0ABU6KBN6_9BACI|nr:Stp1/IreP family PP2C-type Ser/Thr phosphatase [Virgibacillus sp. C22-A2]
MKGQFLTDKGLIRSHNEDSGGIYTNSSGQILAVIADGMGGHQAGDVASQMATALIQEKWLRCTELHTPDETENWLTNTIGEINEAIYNHAMQNEACHGMGTTIVAAICIRDFITVGHIGDSRCYILNENGFKQITEDHSLVNALVQSGQITKEDALNHPRKNVVLKALGTEKEMIADVQTLIMEQSNKILLCTDGLTDKVLDEELCKLMQTSSDIMQTGVKMIELANERGGEDNITLIIMQYDASQEVGGSPC